MIRGADDGKLFVVRDYSEEEVENILEEFFNNLKTIWGSSEEQNTSVSSAETNLIWAAQFDET